jgi:hypothetical protein
MAGKTRCALHGAYATGPVTAEGMARAVTAMHDGRARWLARLKAEGKPIPCGRKKGGRNRTVEEREQAAYEAQCERNYRRVVRRERAERKARRQAQRREAAELERWRAQSNTALPFWDEEESLEFAFAAIVGHGVGRELERGLARLARTFVAELGSGRALSPVTVERVYRDLVRCSDAIGTADCKPAWLEPVHEAYARWQSRLMIDGVIAQVRARRSAE